MVTNDGRYEVGHGRLGGRGRHGVHHAARWAVTPKPAIGASAVAPPLPTAGRRVLRRLLMVTALVPLLVACGSGGEDAATSGPAADEPAPADTEDHEQEVTEAPALALTPEQVEMVLLPAEDLGGLFTEVAGDTSSGNEASPEDLGAWPGTMTSPVLRWRRRGRTTRVC